MTCIINKTTETLDRQSNTAQLNSPRPALLSWCPGLDLIPQPFAFEAAALTETWDKWFSTHSLASKNKSNALALHMAAIIYSHNDDVPAQLVRTLKMQENSYGNIPYIEDNRVHTHRCKELIILFNIKYGEIQCGSAAT